VGSRAIAYVMDVSFKDGGERLTSSREFIVVDTRPRPNGGSVGRPGVSANRRTPALVGQRMFSGHGIQPSCLERMRKTVSVNKMSEFFFICRSGGYSKRTAHVTAVTVFARCRSGGGFEGPINSRRLSGRLAAWNAAGVT
jgi:hypothetical protein